MKHLLRNINLLNTILVAVILLFANYAVLPLFKMEIKSTLPVSKKIVKDKGEEPFKRESPSFTDYIIIAEQNPFHPERILPTLPEDKKEEKPLSRPEIVLYGTVVSGEISLAYVEDKKSPLTTPGRGNRLRVIKKGEEIGGFVLQEIKPDRIILVRGEDKMTVSLTYPPKKREPPPITSPSPQKPKP